MVELACASIAGLCVKARRSEVEYSIETIERGESGSGSGRPLYFLIGADAFAEVGTW